MRDSSGSGQSHLTPPPPPCFVLCNRPTLSYFVATLALTARQHVDMNAALAAVNILWKVSDSLASAAPSAPSRIEGGGGSSTSRSPGRAPLSQADYTALWSQVFTALSSLADGTELALLPRVVTGGGGGGGLSSADPLSSEATVVIANYEFAPAARPEVRNSAASALFASLATHGASMTEAQVRLE